MSSHPIPVHVVLLRQLVQQLNPLCRLSDNVLKSMLRIPLLPQAEMRISIVV